MCACYFYPCLFQLHVLTLFKSWWSVGHDKQSLLLKNWLFVVETSADRPEPGCHENEWNLVSLFKALWKFQLSHGPAVRIVTVSVILVVNGHITVHFCDNWAVLTYNCWLPEQEVLLLHCLWHTASYFALRQDLLCLNRAASQSLA